MHSNIKVTPFTAPVFIYVVSYHEAVGEVADLPALLASKPLVQECQNLGDIELDILKIKVLEVVFLHFQQVIEFQIKLQKSASTTCQKSAYSSSIKAIKEHKPL